MMNLSNFTRGIHSYPAVEGSDMELILARDAHNLRVGADGHLALRVANEQSSVANSGNVTGIGVAGRHLFYLLDTGELRIRRENDPARDSSLGMGQGDLEGRISILDINKDFSLLTSEGEDQGYWIDLQSEDESLGIIGLTPLGFSIPNIQDVEGTYRNGVIRDRDPAKASQGGLVANQWYAYRFTSINGRETKAFAGVESVASGPIAVATNDDRIRGWFVGITSGIGSVFGFPVPFINIDDDFDFEGVTYPEGTSEDDFVFGIHLSGIEFPDDDEVTHIAVYRTGQLGVSDPDDDDYITEGQALRLAGKALYRRIPLSSLRGEANVIDTDGISRTDVELGGITDTFASEDGPDHDYVDQWNALPLLDNNNISNERLPSSCTALAYHEDLVFAACGDEIRYSEFQFGNAQYWAFPEKNSFTPGGTYKFVFTFAEAVYFGDGQHTWRLTGNSPDNFNLDQIAEVGAIDAHSIAQLKLGFGVIGPDGFYVSGGTQLTGISSPYLEGLLENQIFTEGNILVLPDNQVVWSVEGFDPSSGITDRTSYISRDIKSYTQWMRWHGLDILQGTSLIGAKFIHDVWADSDEDFWIDSDEDFWTAETDGESKLQEVVIATGKSATEEIEWRDIKSGQRGDDINWGWESNNLFSPDDKAIKHFKYLMISGNAANDVTVEFYLTQNEGVIRFSETIALRGKYMRSRRIALNRRGNALRFKMSGFGKVTIYSLGALFDRTTMYY